MTAKPIRSMSDTQKIAKYAAKYGWDSEPWQNIDSGEQLPEEWRNARCSFAPRVSRIPAPDPLPWLRPGADTITDPRKSVRVFTYQEYRPRSWPVLRAAGVTREPREFNPVLAMARDRRQKMPNESFRAIRALSLAIANLDPSFTPAQITEARIVLERLQSVIEASK